MNSRPPHIHYHTDCDFFGGCESMLVNLLKDPRLQAQFTLSLSYRDSQAYREGLRKRLAPLPGERALPLLSDAAPGLWARRLPRPLALAMLAVQGVVLLRYWILAWNVLLLARAWRGQRIDLLHINNGGYPGASSARAAALAARWLGIGKVVMVVNNIAAEPRLHEKPAELLLTRMLCKSVHAFVTGSWFANQALRRRLSRCQANFLALHNGIGSRQPDEAPTQTRQRLGVDQEAVVFAIVALHEPRKGHRVLINAVAAMNRTLPDNQRPVILVEGSGPEEPALRQLTAALGLQDQVLFVGRERNVLNLMQCADVLLVPSIANEDFPNVVLEAISLGTPVIASSLAGIPEQIEDGVSGWLVPPGDVNALAQAMVQTTSNRQMVQTAGAAARVRFEQQFTADMAVGRYIKLYRNLLNSKEPN